MESPTTALSRYTTTSPEDSFSPILQLSEDAEKFCTAENMEKCVSYFDHELESLGLDACSDKDGRLDPVEMLNSAYRLLLLYRSSVKRLEDINTSLYRTRSDLTLQTEARNRLKNDVEQLERELASSKEKERQLSQRNKSLSAQLKGEQEDCRRLRLQMQHKDVQYTHEMRKRDREYGRLKDRLGQLVMDRSQERKLGMSLLNGLHRTEAKGRTQADKSSEGMYQLIVQHYEDRQKELLLENSALREALSNMEKELLSLLEQQFDIHSSFRKEHVSGEEEGQNELLGSGYFQMPFALVREEIEQNLREKYQQLRDLIHHLEANRENVPQGCDAEIEELEHKLADYRDIIEQQEQMIQRALNSTADEVQQLPRGLQFVSDSSLLHRAELLNLKDDLVKEKEINLEEMRQKLLDAAKMLDRERQDFEEFKGQFLKEQFLDASVFATPRKANTTNKFDSFFMGLSSTPYPKSCRKGRQPLSHLPPSSVSRNRPPPSSPTMLKHGSPTMLKHGSPIVLKKSSGTCSGELDLSQDVSLCSDDGNEVLNERPTPLH